MKQGLLFFYFLVDWKERGFVWGLSLGFILVVVLGIVRLWVLVGFVKGRIDKCLQFNFVEIWNVLLMELLGFFQLGFLFLLGIMQSQWVQIYFFFVFFIMIAWWGLVYRVYDCFFVVVKIVFQFLNLKVRLEWEIVQLFLFEERGTMGGRQRTVRGVVARVVGVLRLFVVSCWYCLVVLGTVIILKELLQGVFRDTAFALQIYRFGGLGIRVQGFKDFFFKVN